MSHTREEYLAQCQICYKRKFSIDKGLICSLTEKWADFTQEKCPDFDLDQPAFDNIENNSRRRKDNGVDSLPATITNFGIKNELVLGILITVVGFTWLIAGLFYDWFYAYPFALIVIGCCLITVGIIGKIRSK